MAHVLIVDDERDLAALLDFNLRQSGFTTALAHGGEEALALARSQPPDLVVLDRMLPDIPGDEVCRRLRTLAAPQPARVVMLTARGEEEDRVRGFELGVDDYVTKPFSVRELVLRLRAILRRAGVEAARGPLEVGLLSLDTEAHRFLVDGQPVSLTALEFRLMHHFMTRVGRVQSRDRLLEEVWGLSSSLETRTVDTHVMRLRDKLGPARSYVETVRGVGYRLVLPQ